MAGDRNDRRREINEKWDEDFSSKSRKRSNIENREASTDSARLDVIDWLARRWPGRSDHSKRPSLDQYPTDAELAPKSAGLRMLTEELGLMTESDDAETAIVKTVAKLGYEIARPTLNEIDSRFEQSARMHVRRQLTHHFWCDLFAALAMAVGKFENALDEAPEWITESILSSTSHKRRTALTRSMVRKAVEKAWRLMQNVV